MNFSSGTPTSSHNYYPKLSPQSNRQSIYFGQNTQSSAERNGSNTSIINYESKNLIATEEKIKLLLAENSRLLKIISEKDYEIISYHTLGQKVQLLLNENRDLNRLPEALTAENKKLQDIINLKETENKLTEEKYNSLVKLYEQLDSKVQSLGIDFEFTTNTLNECYAQIKTLSEENLILKQQVNTGLDNEERLFKLKNDIQQILMENDKLNTMIKEFDKNRIEDQEKIVKKYLTIKLNYLIEKLSVYT